MQGRLYHSLGRMAIIAAMLSTSISAGLGTQRGDDQGRPSQKGILLEAGLEGAESSKKKRQKLGRSPMGGLEWPSPVKV